MLTTALWTAQIILALFFLAAGLPKILGRGIDRWIGFDDLPRPLTLLIGVAEVAAPVALIAPMVFDVAGWLTPLAAVGLAIVSLMASGFHIRAGEWLPALETALWAMLAGVVAVGRQELLAGGPALDAELLVPVVGVLVVGLAVNIVAIFRTPVSMPEGSPTSEDAHA